MSHKQITRIVSIVFSLFFFVLAIAITVSMSLAMFNFYGEEKSVFFKWIMAILEVYKFSSFLLPLVLLYCSIVLLMPGWSNVSKAVLLVSPFCFFTSVAGEYSLSIILGHIQNSTIASFATWAIVLVTILFIAIEFVVASMIAEKFFKTYKEDIVYQYEVDIIADEYNGRASFLDDKKEKKEKVKKNEESFFSLFKFEEEEKPIVRKDEKLLSEEEEKLSKDSKMHSLITTPEDVAQHERNVTENDDVVVIEEWPNLSKNENVDVLNKEDASSYQENENAKLKNDELKDNKEVVESKDAPSLNENVGKEREESVEEATPLINEKVLKEDENIIEKETNNITLKEEVSLSPENDESEKTLKKEIIEEKSDNLSGEKKIEESFIEETIETPLPKEAIKKEEAILSPSMPPIENKTNIEEKQIKEDSSLDISKEELEKMNSIEAISIKPLESIAKEKREGYNIPFDLLKEYPGNDYWIIDSSTRRSAFALKSTLNEFKINVEITGIRKGPVVTMFEVLPPPGIKLAKISALQDNIALRLAAESVRIVAPIPGKRAVGIEIPNDERSIVGFRELIQVENKEAKKMAIPIVLGKDITGEPQTIDLAQTPHLLIAGATGAGKSVCVNSIILSILYNNRPSEVKLLLVDPKIVELKLYNDIGHLLTPVITEPKKAFQALQYCICEMERRYALLDRMSVRDIKSYNKKIKAENLVMECLPYIVIVIDEFADLMVTTGKELEGTVSRLCAMSRAVGIHLVLATQRPSTDVITGLIKANIPSRIAFMVASRIDSRIILDDGGAEKLLGKGDMLYVSPAKPWPTRIQGAFVSEEEVERVVEKVKSFGEPCYIDDEIFMDEDEEKVDSFFGGETDPLYDEALDIVINEGKASASYIQRRLKIGYNRAARIIEEMEERGVVGPANGSKARDILQSF